ncbi:hypothetical protein AGDE_12921 [Angomonas deanei]|uniref:Uncharacterized protein n=1 Tax=Angomonas deanei TaxID=59799 RepID=A0A7G2C617_9TRYP|nr:hypothetical protein AGDE_12921 [Angomonas deanei]CAD2213322.1 hypothetical protein, conserved [Angomonas deanei]|eukprot:EPY23370.1 hypothetical protein AGDE_12921 [Angomonas deanei]
MVQDGTLMAKIAKVGWRKVQSINDVPADSIVALATEIDPVMAEDDLNSLIPIAMDQRGTPLGATVTVDCEADDGKTETHAIQFEVVTKEQLAALQKNFEGIIALGKATGLKPEEINAIFVASYEAYQEANGAQSAQASNMMGNMMNQMMGMMGGAGGPAGADCQQQ